MPKTIEINISPQTNSSPELIKKAISQELNIKAADINHIEIIRRSIDARNKSVVFRIKADVYTKEEKHIATEYKPDYKNVSNKPSVIIIGAGPAGLFAALSLIKNNLKPIILERGKDISERKQDIQLLNSKQSIKPDSNYCYGLGGAGTFSDGKLYSRSNKRGDIKEILNTLVYHGADPSICIDTHPHIGTDKLPQIIKNIKDCIIEYGGEIHFNARVTDFEIESNTITHVICNNGDKYDAQAFILAAGNSARNIFTVLQKKSILIEEKPFALGVRIEHPQALIDSIQYHSHQRGELLPTASYSHTTTIDNKGVYSFCMCPGGTIVPSMTKKGQIVVNGMSNSKRNSPYANSGIVVEVNKADFADYKKFGPLAGMHFQENLEKKAYIPNAANDMIAPAQRMLDFMNNKQSSSLPSCSYNPGISSAPLHEIVPEFISKRIQKAFSQFDKKMRGYLTNEAVLLAFESRTSSPVYIPRDKAFQHLQIKNLYPCGEGSGYAGGITSSAIDGINSALSVQKTIIS